MGSVTNVAGLHDDISEISCSMLLKGKQSRYVSGVKTASKVLIFKDKSLPVEGNG